MLFLILFYCSTGRARAEDNALAQVNRNIVRVYVASAECVETVSPGPDMYVKMIGDYFANLYPFGIGYWVLPEIKELQRDKGICIINLEDSLLKYQRSLYDYKALYPNNLQPPMLLAYQWREILKKTDNAAIKAPIPLPSKPKGDESKQRF